MRPVWQLHPSFFRGSGKLLRVFKFSARAEAMHQLVLRVIEGVAMDDREEIETRDPHGGNPQSSHPRPSADNFASDF